MLNMVEGFDVLLHYVTALRKCASFHWKNKLVLGIMEVFVVVITRIQITQVQKTRY